MLEKLQAALAKFNGYFTELLHDIDGYPSMKRLGFLVSLAVVVGSFLANVFWRIVVDEHIIQAALGLGGTSIGGVALERFGKILPSTPGSSSAHPDKPEDG